MVVQTGNCTDYNSSTDCTCTKSQGNYLSSHYFVCAVLYVNHDKIILEFCYFSIEAIEWAFCIWCCIASIFNYYLVSKHSLL